MLFNSYLFLCGFFPAALAGFAVACRLGDRAASAWLLLASMLFYAWGSVAFVPILLTSIACNFAAVRLILATEGARRRLILVLAIGINLSVLVWYKYLSAVLVFFSAPLPAPTLPLGISFFTFTQIGYLLDCHAALEGRRSFLEYALFVAFFPHLIAGPIVTGREIIPSFRLWRLSAGNLSVGGAIFVIGLLKKTLLADPISSLAIAGFNDPSGLTLFSAWRAVLAWSLQLYFDFSGYSDMAVGLARMFGVAFPFNFNQPYKATSIIDYWQRWHISLTRFIMSTIHAPLTLALMRWRRARGHNGGANSVVGFGELVMVPVFASINLAGIWHGAGLTFVAFGLLHAVFLTLNHAWRRGPWFAMPAGAAAALTYLCVLIATVAFRASSLPAMTEMYAALFGLHGLGVGFEPRDQMDALWLAALFAIVWFAPSTQTLTSPRFWRVTPARAVAMGFAMSLGLLAVGGTGEFLYFQF